MEIVPIIMMLSYGNNRFNFFPWETTIIPTMKEASGVDFPVREAPRRPGDPPILIADNTKILRHLHWRPQCDDLALICKTALAWEKKIA